MSKETITKKSNKDDIYDAYQAALAQLNEVQANKVDFASMSETKAKATVLDKVKETKTEIKDATYWIKQLESQYRSITEKLDVIEQLDESIKIKDAELLEITGIERAAYSMAALVNAQKEYKAKTEEEIKQEKLKAEEERKAIFEDMNRRKQDVIDDIKKLEKESTEKRKKEEEEYQYSFRRKKMVDLDILNDELTEKRKEFEKELEEKEKDYNVRNDTLNIRNAQLYEREQKLDSMEKTIAEFPSTLAEAIQIAKDEGKKEADKSNVFETRYIKKEAESKIEVLENKIENLNDTLSAERARNIVLEDKLTEAYNKLEALASKTVDGASSSKYATALEGALKEKAGQVK